MPGCDMSLPSDDIVPISSHLPLPTSRPPYLLAPVAVDIVTGGGNARVRRAVNDIDRVVLSRLGGCRRRREKQVSNDGGYYSQTRRISASSIILLTIFVAAAALMVVLVLWRPDFKSDSATETPALTESADSGAAAADGAVAEGAGEAPAAPVSDPAAAPQ